MIFDENIIGLEVQLDYAKAKIVGIFVNNSDEITTVLLTEYGEFCKRNLYTTSIIDDQIENFYNNLGKNKIKSSSPINRFEELDIQ